MQRIDPYVTSAGNSKMRLLWFLFIVVIPAARCWESDEMDVFDVVEEVNKNFYEAMEISQDAELSEIKKAYRRLSKILHPDKSDAEDAEVQFRQLVSIYEVLRDDGKRKIYDRVLVEGLPDWRSPIYYYRRARKMSMLEISLILTAVISITQYLMAWGSYIDHRHTLEELLVRKYKIKDRRKKKVEDLENLEKMENELNEIPKPSWWNILPIQFVKLLIFLVTGGPSMARSILESIRLEKERKQKEKEEEEEEERRIKEEEEKRKEKRAQRSARKRVNKIPDLSNGGCILESGDDPDDSTKGRPPKPAPGPAPVVTGGPWTDEDFTELARLMAKFPGGTAKRWNIIAESMGRTVYEVTKMSNKIMERLAVRHSEQENEGLVPEAKEKVKTKGEKIDMSAGSDEAWTAVQQKALEKALKQNPKGTDQRWEKIARQVPDKAKEECMLRFKFLADKIKKKKLGEEEVGNKEESNTAEDESEKRDEQITKTEESQNNQSSDKE